MRVCLRVILILLCLTLSSFAAAENFPRGCEVSGFAYRDNNLMLNETGQQAFYLLQNRALGSVILERYETRDVFMSPSLQCNLEPTKWAAFASDEVNLYFKCSIKSTDGNLTQVPCGDVLEVCQYPRVKFALSNMGNYWVSTNKPQGQVIKEAAAKGILLRW